MNLRALASLILLNSSLLHADTVNWDGGGDGTSWTQAANWVGDVLPTAGDDVVINVVANPVIQVANALNVRSLNSEEDIFFSSTLTLTGGSSVIKATAFSERNITISGGATVQFPSLTSFVHTANRTVTLQVSGAGSSLSFPNATTIQGPGNTSRNLYLTALNGGQINFPLATQVTSGAVTFTADGAASSIDLDDLTSFTGRLYFGNSGFHAFNGGTVLIPALATLQDGDIQCDTPGKLDLDQLTTFTGSGTATLTGGVHDLSALTTLTANFVISTGSVPLLTSLSTVENSSISVSGGSVLELPLVTSLLHSENANNTFLANGIGSRLAFPNVTSIQGPSGNSDNLYFSALNGGQLEVPKATQVTSGAVTFTSDGTGSSIDLDDLATFTGKLYFSNSGFHALNGGSILSPVLTTLTDGDIQCDTPGNLDLDQLTALTGSGTTTLTGGVHDLSSLTTFKANIVIPLGSVPLLTSLATVENASITLTGGAILNLPLVTSLVHTENANNSLIADGTGSRLSFPNVTSIQGPLGNSDNFYFSALNGGHLEVPKATQVINGAVIFTANGTGSVLDLDDLATFTGKLYFSNSGFFTLNGGVILTPVLTTIHDGDLSSDAPGSLNLATLTDLTGAGTVTLTGGIHDLTSLTTLSATLQVVGGSVPVVTSLSNINGAAISVSGGAVLNLPLVTAYTQSTNSDRTLLADGSGSRLQFPNLTTLTSNNATSRKFLIRALNGGKVILSAVTTVSNPTTNSSIFQFIADGTNSLIDLTSLLSISPTTAQLIATNSGVIFTPGLNNATLPDFHVLSLVPSTTTLTPGSILSLTWSVQNDGGVDFDGSRRDSIFLASDASGTNATRIANFTISGLLATGTSQSITRDITVPNTGLNGTVFLLVRTDEASGVIESNETNNQASTSALTLPSSLTLKINRSEINEKNGGTATGNLSRNGNTTASLTVNLSALPANQLTHPATVTFSAGQSTRSFTITPIDDQIPDGDATVTITAQAAGFTAGQASIIVLDGSVPALAISVDESAPTEGDIVNVTVTRNKTTGPLNVTLSKTPANQATLASPLVFADGEASKSASLTIIDDVTAEQDTLLRLTAGATGYVGASVDLTIIDNDQPTLALALNRSILSEAAGPGELLATISRTTATSEALRVGISGSTPGLFEPLGTVFIPANQTSVTVSLNPIDNTTVDGLRSVTLWAQAFEASSGQLLVESPVQALDLTDDDGPTLTLTTAKKVLIEGATTSVTITRNVVTASPLSVSLSHNGDARVTLPINTTIPANQATVTVPLITTDNATTDGTSSLELIASAAAYSPGYSTLTLSDESRPELLVTRVTGIPEVNTNEIGSYSYRIENQGSTAAKGPIAVQIFLSTDQARSDDDRLLTEYLFEADIPAGLYFERSGSFVAPVTGGPHYVIVRVDPLGAVDEIIETNNSAVSGLINIITAYSATVATTLNVEPSGTEVPLTGSATTIGGSPAAFKLVNIHIMVRETKRIISALTDSSGNFSATFRPLPGEAGSYTIGATHPGTPVATAQDSFTLLGFNTDPSSLSRKLVSDDSVAIGSFTLKNPADLAQSGLTFTLLNAPAGLTTTFTPTSGSTLGSLAQTTVNYTLSASPSTPAGTYDASLRITGAEGGLRQIALTLTVCQNTSELTVSDRPLRRSMIPGQQSFLNFTVRNTGGASTGPLHLTLPNVPWLSNATASPLPSLAPDQEATISLQLCPAADLPLGINTGSLLLQANDSSLAVPYRIRTLSQAKGTLVVSCEDDYTYFAASQPPLAGAIIVIRDALNNSIAATGTSALDGTATFTDLNEGYYDIIVSADKHTTFRETIFLEAGDDTPLSAFLKRRTVEYLWTVFPTQIEDRYRIVIDTVFETNVPAPVVTISPALIDLEALTAETTQVDITFTNHGLIAAANLKSSFTSSSTWQITTLTEDLGDLPAKSSITIPITIKNLLWDPSRSAPRAGNDCPKNQSTWDWECGDLPVRDGGNVTLIARCGGGGSGGSADPGGGGVPPPGGFFVVPSGGKTSCNTCLAKALLECYVGYFPGSGFVMCPYGFANASNRIDVAQAGLTCLCTPVESVGVGVICNTVNCFVDILQCLDEDGGASGGVGGRPGRGSVLTLPAFTAFNQAGRDMMTFLDFLMISFGDDAWRELLGSPLLPPLATSLTESMKAGSGSGTQISTTERAAALATGLGTSEPALVNALIDRMNRTHSYYDMGIYEIEDLTPGMNDDFITLSSAEAAAAALVEAVDRNRANGFADPFEAYVSKQDDLLEFLTAGEGVCATVKLRIEQNAVMTRDAFEASLEMINSDTFPLENLNVSLSIVDFEGSDKSALFGITGSGVVNGTVPPESSDKWTWTIIPTAQAAPTGEVQYYVRGTVSYMQDGLVVEIPLAPQPITVQPTPSLTLKYFHQRDVFSDDPHTDIIEPSIPFSLGVMIQNGGAGIARNLRITSAQPVIIENEKGLFADFQIIASEVSGQSLSPSLTTNFGEFQPGQIKIGRWLMTSSIQGLFTDYQASFEHLNALDDDRLSLIQGVTIHETNHVVAAPGSFNDGLPDFLVNDIADFGDFPDTVHLSDGSVETVTPLATGSAPAPTPLQLQVTLTTDTPSGWMYARLPDPGDGDFRLTQVVRSDGRVLPLDINAWTTDRSFIGLGLQPVRENKLHLFDHDTTGSYTLTYVVLPPADTQAPSSSIAMLPLANSGFFSVDWSGTDNNSVSSYDIYVSTNGGPFTRWLEKTSKNSALYQGTFGNDYAFFSIARDAAGNIEATKTSGEANTTVSLVNQAPVLNALADVTLTEGQSLTRFASATDPDGPASALRYSIVTSDPGITINALSGRIRWNTTESHGGTIATITVTVTDSDADPASASLTFNVTVLDDNKPPVLASLPTTVLEIGQSFSIFARGSDPDLPLQTLSYQIVSAAPAGMTINATTGELTWTPLGSHGDQTFEIEIQVSDNQTSPLTARRTLLIEVLEDPGFPPVFDPVNAQIWLTGGSYFLQLHAVDPEGSPVSLSADFTGLPGWLSLDAPAASGKATLYWHTSDIPPGIYLIPVTAETERQSTTAFITIEIIARDSFLDYEGWATAYNLVGTQRTPTYIAPGSGVSNYLAYAFGIDPVGGISPAQHEPRPTVLTTGSDSAIAFQLPDGGRPDLRYTVQTSVNLNTWETIGIKEGTQPWDIGAVVTEDQISPNIAIIKVWHDRGTDDDDQRLFRIIIESLAN